MTWQRVKVSPINAGGAAVKWYFGDGTTSNNSTVTHRYQTTGKYQIKLVLTSPLTGCKDSTIVEVQIDPSSIETTERLNAISLYPNPGKQRLFLKSDASIEGSTISIVAMTGQVVYTQVIHQETLLKGIQIQDLSPGIYAITIQGHDSVIWVKE